MCNLYNVGGPTNRGIDIKVFISQVLRSLGQSEPDLSVLDFFGGGKEFTPFNRPMAPIITQEGKLALASWTFMPGRIDPYDQEAVRLQSMNTANIRSETMFDKPTFKEAARKSRCLILASYYNEWKWLDSKGKKKQKWKIGFEGDQPFFFGGLCQEWNGELTFGICSKPANALMTDIHNGVRDFSGEVDPRCMVIPTFEAHERWLVPSNDSRNIADILLPRDDDGLIGTHMKRPDEMNLEFDF